MKTGKRVAAAVCALLLIICIVCGGITFARFREAFIENAGAQVANAVAHYARNGLYRTSDEGSVIVPIDQNSSRISVSDIQPEDVIDFYFSVTDTYGNLKNQVPLRIEISFSVCLRIRTDDKLSDMYAQAGETYSSDNLLVNSQVLFYKDAYFADHGNASNGIDVLPDNTLSSTDFSGELLFVANDGERIVHSTGFYFAPAGDAATAKSFRLSVKVPGQADNVDTYAGAQIIIDLSVAVEQLQELPDGV